MLFNIYLKIKVSANLCVKIAMNQPVVFWRFFMDIYFKIAEW